MTPGRSPYASYYSVRLTDHGPARAYWSLLAYHVLLGSKTAFLHYSAVSTDSLALTGSPSGSNHLTDPSSLGSRLRQL